MKITVFVLAFVLAGCFGSGSPQPLPTSIPTGETAPVSEPATAEPTAEMTDTPAEPTPTPGATPTENTTSEPPYPAVEAADSAPYPAVQAAADDSPYPAPGQGSARFPGADGLTIEGELSIPENAPEPWPAVLLLHMLGSDKEAWGDLPARLAEAGYAALAIDMRGHGGTGGDIDWAIAEEDHRRALDYLAGIPGVDASRLAVIGASIGSNLALRTGADLELIRTVILLSPGLDYAGVTTEGALADFGDRPVLILVSSEDTYAAESSETLAEQALGEVELEIYQDAGHGTDLITGEPGVIDTILEWLDQTTN
ncbi:MAG TPA: alpha/beta fold hydrolase [Anaerolineales bacterium]|nr:alpha/beta fold hydrolase [Anaerolineales bacterium]